MKRQLGTEAGYWFSLGPFLADAEARLLRTFVALVFLAITSVCVMAQSATAPPSVTSLINGSRYSSPAFATASQRMQVERWFTA